MRIIQTYVPTRGGSDLNKSLLQNMIYSVLCAKSLYETIELYTTNEIAQVIKKIGIPYDKIITEPFDSFKSNTFSIPKLVTYSLQVEDFIHIDIDTFLYKKIEVDKSVPYFYDHPDVDLTTPKNFNIGINLYETYIKNTSKIKDLIPKEIQEFIDFTDIPNMNIFGTYNPKVVAEASKICLEFYYDNFTFFDSDYYNACIIEQLLVPATIKKLNKSFYKNHYLTDSPDVFRIEKNEDSLETTTYPVYLNFSGTMIPILDEYSLFLMVNYDYRVNIHLGGYKYLDIFQFLIRETIIHRFNKIDLIKNIDDIYTDVNSYQEISERYYEHMLYTVKKRITELKTKKNFI